MAKIWVEIRSGVSWCARGKGLVEAAGLDRQGKYVLAQPAAGYPNWPEEEKRWVLAKHTYPQPPVRYPKLPCVQPEMYIFGDIQLRKSIGRWVVQQAIAWKRQRVRIISDGGLIAAAIAVEVQMLGEPYGETVYYADPNSAMQPGYGGWVNADYPHRPVLDVVGKAIGVSEYYAFDNTQRMVVARDIAMLLRMRNVIRAFRALETVGGIPPNQRRTFRRAFERTRALVLDGRPAMQDWRKEVLLAVAKYLQLPVVVLQPAVFYEIADKGELFGGQIKNAYDTLGIRTDDGIVIAG